MPISNRVMTFWLMAAPAATVITGALLATLLVNVLFNARWPWLRPAIYFSVGASLLQTFYWRLLIGRPRQVLIFAGVIGLLLWLMGFVYFPNGVQQPIVLRSPFTAMELAFVAGVWITVASFGCHAPGRARSNDGLDGGALRDLIAYLRNVDPDLLFGRFRLPC